MSRSGFAMAVTRLTVRVHPRARANEVVGFDEADQLKVRVTAPPADGKANVAVIALLSDILGVAKSAVTIERGDTARLKVVRIDGLPADVVWKKLARGI
jgi:uncharacterized protein (TIGR00251 family)